MGGEVIVAVANEPFEALLLGAPAGLGAALSVGVYDPTNAVQILPATNVGITEPQPGTYRVALTVATAGTFMVRWEWQGVSAEEELTVTAAPLPPGGAYASITDLRAMSGLDAARLPDARAQTLLDAAHRDIDGALGVGWRAYTRAADGRLVDITLLDTVQADALTRATVTQAVYRELKGEAHFVAPDGGGPVSPEAVRELDRVGLRRLTGRMG